MLCAIGQQGGNEMAASELNCPNCGAPLQVENSESATTRCSFCNSVVLLPDDREGTADSVERLMGTKAEARFAFISDKAEFASEELLDV